MSLFFKTQDYSFCLDHDEGVVCLDIATSGDGDMRLYFDTAEVHLLASSLRAIAKEAAR